MTVTKLIRSPAQEASAQGQALMAQGKHAQAEQAFAQALRHAPKSADLWVLFGMTRYRQGALEAARAAMREALRHAPDHAVAADNLAVLSAPRLGVWKPKDKAAALGLAVEFLSKMPAFAALPFGEWSQVLFYQVARGHFFFVVDQDERVRGFLGWALTEQALAEDWVAGRAGLRSDQCLDGDCVIVNAFAAETEAANRFIIDTMRRLFTTRRMLYFKRHYADSRARPGRLSLHRKEAVLF